MGDESSREVDLKRRVTSYLLPRHQQPCAISGVIFQTNPTRSTIATTTTATFFSDFLDNTRFPSSRVQCTWRYSKWGVVMFRFISFEKVLRSFYTYYLCLARSPPYYNDDVTTCTRDVTTACQEVDLDRPSVLAVLDVRAEAPTRT